MRKELVSGLTGVMLVVGMLLPSLAAAQTPGAGNVRINTHENAPVTRTFLMAPTRLVLALAPGEKRTVDVELMNELGVPNEFTLSTEDFVSDPDQGWAAKFLGIKESPFSAMRWLTPEIRKVKLEHGQRAFIRLTISVPTDAEPGDHQVALIATKQLDGGGGGGLEIASRVASLFIITVEGDVVKDGDVDSLAVGRYFNWFLPVQFRLHAVNRGTIHMAPEGTVTIRNIFGIPVDELPVHDWYILRESERDRDFTWQPRFALGYYSATADLVVFDESNPTSLAVSFWVVPLVPVLLILIAIFVVSFLVQYFFSRFEIKRK